MAMTMAKAKFVPQGSSKGTAPTVGHPSASTDEVSARKTRRALETAAASAEVHDMGKAAPETKRARLERAAETDTPPSKLELQHGHAAPPDASPYKPAHSLPVSAHTSSTVPVTKLPPPRQPSFDMDAPAAHGVVSGVSAADAAAAANAKPGLRPREVSKWTVEHVGEFVSKICADAGATFVSAQIDGEALLLLKMNHLTEHLSIKLGPALKILAALENVQKAQQCQPSLDTKSKLTV